MTKPLHALVMALTLMSGLGSPVQAKENLKVLFINPGFATGFWGSVTDTMVAAADDMNISLTVMNADRDRIRMLDLAQEALTPGHDWDYAVIVNELQQGPVLADIFDDADVPYVFLLNRLAPEQMTGLRAQGRLRGYIGSITPRNFETGYRNAQALIAQADAGEDGVIQMLALLGDTATPAATEREAGMRAAVAEAGNVEIVRAFSVDWLFDRAKSAVELFLKADRAEVIWTASGPIAFGAMEAVVEAGLRPGQDIKFAGVGWFQNALNAVDDGRMVQTFGGYFISGAWSMVILRDHDSGVVLENEGEIEAPLSGVDPSNIVDFQRIVNGVDWSHIDFATFSRSETDRNSYEFSRAALFAAIKEGANGL